MYENHMRLHKKLTQDKVRKDLISQAYDKMVQNEKERVGNINGPEFILNLKNLAWNNL